MFAKSWRLWMRECDGRRLSGREVIRLCKVDFRNGKSSAPLNLTYKDCTSSKQDRHKHETSRALQGEKTDYLFLHYCARYIVVPFQALGSSCI
jgi:hypothetical protein